MLEIFAIIVLANTNAKNAVARGRKPGGFRGLTLGLWFGGELLGFFIGMVATDGEMLPAYGVALLFAIIGGMASYIISKTCKPGAHQELQHGPLMGARPLEIPCALTIIREKSFVSALVTYGVYANGRHVGDLKNGESIQVSTALVQNVIVAKDSYGTEIKPLLFTVPSGGAAQIVFGPQRFMPQKCNGITLLSDADVLSLAQDTPNPPAPDAYPQANEAQPTPQYDYAPQAETVLSLPENPLRAVWAMGGALLFMLLSAFLFLPKFGLSIDVTLGLVSLSYSLVLGACVYLMLQNGVKYKVISGAGLVLGAVLRAFSVIFLSMYAGMLSAPPITAVFGQSGFGANLGAAAITAAVVGVTALVMALVHRGTGRQKLFAAAWISMGAAVLAELFNMRHLLARPDYPLAIKLGITASNIIDILCIALFALLIHMLCTLKRKELNTGTGAKIWFGVCAGFTFVGVFASIASGTMGIDGALIAVVGIIGYILLLASKRVGFPIILTVVLMNVVAGVSAGFAGRSPSVLNAVIPLAGLINPLITWLVVRNAWNDLSPAEARPTSVLEKPKVNIAFKISAIWNTLLGGVLFVTGVYSVLDSRDLYSEPFFLGVILGSLVAALGITAIVQSFGKRIKARSWLLIPNLVIACLALVMLGAAVVSGLFP